MRDFRTTSYEVIQPQLIRAGRVVTEKQAERRVLMLINPSMSESEVLWGTAGTCR